MAEEGTPLEDQHHCDTKTRQRYHMKEKIIGQYP